MCSLVYIRRMYSLVNDTFKPYTNQKKCHTETMAMQKTLLHHTFYI